MEMPSKVEPIRNFKPVTLKRRAIASTSRQADLRDELQEHRAGARNSVQRNQEAGPIRDEGQPENLSPAAEQIRKAEAQAVWRAELIRRAKEIRDAEPMHPPAKIRRVERNRDEAQIRRNQPPPKRKSAYVAAQQETFSAPISGMKYPPVRMTLPTPISRRDPSLIGMSEIFVHPPAAANICPISPGGHHKLFRCKTMMRSSLVERWYRALKAGVCLNCMLRGLSSFSCRSEGACVKCGSRHNSILCPRNPKNEQTDETDRAN